MKENSFLKDAKVEAPVLCGPMYPGSNPELIAAVSKAGGLGVVQPISLTYVYGHDFRAGLKLIKELSGNKPFGLNLTLFDGVSRYKKRMDEWLNISIEEGCKFLITSLGNPGWVVKKAREHNIAVYHDITTKKFAEKAVDAGVDGLICVNNSAGGQTGKFSASKLVKDLKHIDLPLVCAGGIGNEEDFLQAIDMGYSAVQLGTRFLASKECDVQEDYKKAIVDSTLKDIVITNKLAGVPSSVIRTDDIAKGGLLTNPISTYLLKQPQTKKLMRGFFLVKTILNLKKTVAEKGYGKKIWQAGKSVKTINSLESAEDIMSSFKQAWNNKSL